MGHNAHGHGYEYGHVHRYRNEQDNAYEPQTHHNVRPTATRWDKKYLNMQVLPSCSLSALLSAPKVKQPGYLSSDEPG